SGWRPSDRQGARTSCLSWPIHRDADSCVVFAHTGRPAPQRRWSGNGVKAVEEVLTSLAAVVNREAWTAETTYRAPVLAPSIHRESHAVPSAAALAAARLALDHGLAGGLQHQLADLVG